MNEEVGDRGPFYQSPSLEGWMESFVPEPSNPAGAEAGLTWSPKGRELQSGVSGEA